MQSHPGVADRSHRVVRRQRKVDIVAFVSALVLGFPSATTRTLAGLRRSYTLSMGESMAPSSFNARFTPALVALMKALADNAIAALAGEATRPRGIFDAFRGVHAADSSLVRLHDALAEHYPSVWTNHTKASAKLGMVINVLGRSPHTLSPSASAAGRSSLRSCRPNIGDTATWMRRPWSQRLA